MGRRFMACACEEHYGGDALACARSIASGTKTPCACDCHATPAEPADWLRTAAAVIVRDYPAWDAAARQLAQNEQNPDAYDRHMLKCITNKLRWLRANHGRGA